MTTTAKSLIHKHAQGFEKTISRDQREFSFVATRYEVDRDGEVVLPSGLDTQDYKKNPVLALQHDPLSPIGRVLVLKLGPADGQLAWLGLARIDPPGTSEAADRAYKQLASGSLNGISIGFQVLESSPRPVLPGQTGPTYKKTRLLEISLVTIPSCANCLVLEKALRKETAMNSCACQKTAIDWSAINRSASRNEVNLDSRAVQVAIARVVPELVARSIAGLAAVGAEAAMNKLTGRLD